MMDSKEDPNCKILSRPSECIKYYHDSITLNDAEITLSLVTMKRSFLLVINSTSSDELLFSGQPKVRDGDKHLTMEDMVLGFTNSNPALKGLSLAIGDNSTCIINSNNSLASATLASRLSKKLNQGRPVYVANNYTIPQDTLEPGTVMARLYMKIFQFASMHYNEGGQVSEPAEQTDKV